MDVVFGLSNIGQQTVEFYMCAVENVYAVVPCVRDILIFYV